MDLLAEYLKSLCLQGKYVYQAHSDFVYYSETSAATIIIVLAIGYFFNRL